MFFRKLNQFALLGLMLVLSLFIAACGGSAVPQESQAEPFVIGAIPDQDPELLQRLYGKLATYLESELGVPVVYKPVTDYTAAVTAFKVGDLDMVWFGGLTGVQARLQVDGAEAIIQRNIDEQFHSVFIANTASGVEPIEDVSGLAELSVAACSSARAAEPSRSSFVIADATTSAGSCRRRLSCCGRRRRDWPRAASAGALH